MLNTRLRRQGFTLLEMMIVVGIIALLMGAGIAYLTDPFVDAQKVKAQTDITAITTALFSFRARNGNYPSTEQGLKALTPNVMEKLPKDPWNRNYAYRFPGKMKPHSFDLYSQGSDESNAADDIGNWDLP
jgi:general secretion pathway protein G